MAKAASKKKRAGKTAAAKKKPAAKKAKIKGKSGSAKKKAAKKPPKKAKTKPGAKKKTAAKKKTPKKPIKPPAKPKKKPMSKKAPAKKATIEAKAKPAVKKTAGQKPVEKTKIKPAKKKLSVAETKVLRAARAARRRKLKNFRVVLVNRHQDLVKAYISTKGNTRNTGTDGTEDYIDYAVSSYDRDFSLSLTEMERKQIRLVEEALRRIDTGNYGACQQCDQEIPEKRLEVEPWARHCIRCQELEDRGLLEERLDDDQDDDDQVEAGAAGAGDEEEPAGAEGASDDDESEDELSV